MSNNISGSSVRLLFSRIGKIPGVHLKNEINYPESYRLEADGGDDVFNAIAKEVASWITDTTGIKADFGTNHQSDIDLLKHQFGMMSYHISGVSDSVDYLKSEIGYIDEKIRYIDTEN